MWVGCDTEKEIKNRRHTFLLVGLRQCVRHRLVRRPFAVQVKSDCVIIKRETFRKVTTGLSVIILYIHPSRPHHPGNITGHNAVPYKGRDLPTWTSAHSVWRCVHSHHYPQRLDVFSDLVLLQTNPRWSYKAANPKRTVSKPQSFPKAALVVTFLHTTYKMAKNYLLNIYLSNNFLWLCKILFLII